MAYQTVSKATIRENVFNTVTTLIDSNKLSGWTVLSAYPEQNPVFPCVVINPAAITVKGLSLDRTKNRFSAEVICDIYSLAKQGKKKNDQGRDNFQNTISANVTALAQYNLLLPTEAMSDEGSDSIELNGQTLNFGTIVLNLVVRI
jgi:hypothetical protein